MKRRWILGSALALGLVACGGDDNGGRESADVDGSPDAMASDAGHASDANAVTTDGGHEAAADGGVAEASRADGTVDSTVRDGGEDSTVDGGTEDSGVLVAAKDAAIVAADASSTDATSNTASDAGHLDSGSTVDSGTDAGAPLDSGAPSYALFVGTDYASAELSVVHLHPDSVAGNLPIAAEDTAPYASSGRGFLLEESAGDVVLLSGTTPWLAQMSIDINDGPEAGEYASNPRAVVVTAGSKAYVARYASNVVKIIDVETGTVTGTVDLSAFANSGDPDGLVEVQDGAYDPTSHRTYFLLQRISQYAQGLGPDYVTACLPWNGEIVAVDSTTDTIVDLNGAAPGQAIDLLGANPEQFHADFAEGRFIVSDTGCYGAVDADAGSDAAPPTPPRLQRGIESVVIATATPTWLYQTNSLDRLSGFVWVDDSHAFVNQGSTWSTWNPTQSALGGVLPNFPQAPLYDGAGRVVGLQFVAASPEAGAESLESQWSVVAFDVATSTLSTLAASPFHSVVPASSYGVSAALLH